MVVRRILTNTDDVATNVASDMATANLNPDKFKFLKKIFLPGGRVIVVWGYDSG